MTKLNKKVEVKRKLGKFKINLFNQVLIMTKSQPFGPFRQSSELWKRREKPTQILADGLCQRNDDTYPLLTDRSILWWFL